jgi:hypothetical protein
MLLTSIKPEDIESLQSIQKEIENVHLWSSGIRREVGQDSKV